MDVVDALTFLRNDHESVLGMFEALDGAPRGEGAQVSGLDTMVTNLVIAESQHEAIEQQFFWPAVRKALDDGDDLADRAIAQEDEGKQLLQKLEKGNPGESEYHTALAEFIVAGRAHIAFEQDVVWPRFRESMDARELRGAGREVGRGEEDRARPVRIRTHRRIRWCRRPSARSLRPWIMSATRQPGGPPTTRPILRKPKHSNPVAPTSVSAPPGGVQAQLVPVCCSWVNGLAPCTAGVPSGLASAPWFLRRSVPSHSCVGSST